jgi:hypothetical protein
LRGHEVHTAADLAQASALASSHEFDLVLTDWRLPDGTALPLFDQGAAPIVVISGHPEEVATSPRVLAVMQKPLMPDRLFELVARCARPVTACASKRSETTCDLPSDVRMVAEAALSVLADTECELVDDGTFVTLRARNATEAQRDELKKLGGDLRCVGSGDAMGACEIRWLRDGRSDAVLPTVAADATWPIGCAFAVDFHGSALGVEAMAVCCERAARRRESGVHVELLNVPEALVRHLADVGLSSLLPQRHGIGPRIVDEFSALWG